MPDDAVEGELLDSEESAELDRRRGRGRVSQLRAASGQVVHWVRESEHPVAKTAARNSLYVLLGVLMAARRIWEAKTNSRYERMMRAAEAAGDMEWLADWEHRAEQAKDRRHKRRMDWIGAPLKLLKAVCVLLLGALGALLGLGVLLALANKDLGLLIAPFIWVLALVAWVTTVVTVGWTFVMVAAPVAGVGYLWHLGKTAGRTPVWLRTETDVPDAVVVDERAIAHALQHLGIAPLARYFADGGQLIYTRIPARDGLGVAAQVRVPPGVTAEVIIAKKTLLAANLGRAWRRGPPRATRRGCSICGWLTVAAWTPAPGCGRCPRVMTRSTCTGVSRSA